MEQDVTEASKMFMAEPGWWVCECSPHKAFQFAAYLTGFIIKRGKYEGSNNQ